MLPDFKSEKAKSVAEKINKSLGSVADPDPGSGIGCLFDPGSRIRKTVSRKTDSQPPSEKLVYYRR
jgi:hypothetical protein